MEGSRSECFAQWVVQRCLLGHTSSQPRHFEGHRVLRIGLLQEGCKNLILLDLQSFPLEGIARYRGCLADALLLDHAKTVKKTQFECKMLTSRKPSLRPIAMILPFERSGLYCLVQGRNEYKPMNCYDN